MGWAVCGKGEGLSQNTSEFINHLFKKASEKNERKPLQSSLLFPWKR